MKSFACLVLAGLAAAAPGMHHARIVDRAEAVEDVYDFVVVGAGTAGLTLADRLSEDGKNSVLVIEYGYVISEEVTQRGGGRSFAGADLRYNITSTAQPGMNNRTQDVVVGCCVGGSSAINGMVMMRGTSDEYDAWRELAGPAAREESTWDWEGVLPYFKKAIHYTPALEGVREGFNITYDEGVWGEESLIYASYPDYFDPALKTMYDAMASMPGVDIPLDGAAGTNGLFWFPTSMFPPGHEHEFWRSYARTGHYDTIVSRKNLEVLQGHKVTRILLDVDEEDAEDVRATGVEFRRRGSGYSGDRKGGVEGGFGKKGEMVEEDGEGTGRWERKRRQEDEGGDAEEVPKDEEAEEEEDGEVVFKVRARKEVILSAGSVHSPQILQLSGIGPKDLLESAGIDVVVELPGVGQNFQDHAWIGNIAYDLSKPLVGPEMNLTGGDPRSQGMNLGAWLGMPVVSPDWESIADRYAAQDPAAHLPANTHPHVIEGYKHFQAAHSKLLRTKNANFLWVPINTAPGRGGVMLMHVVSHGTINIDPADPNGEPIVDYRSLSNPTDLELLVEHVKFMRRFVLESGLFEEYEPVETSPGPEVVTDEEIAEFVRESVTPTNYHPVATTAKMPREWGGVVDEELRVWGVKRLRVVDAGIMPCLPGAQTQQSSYMIGEKGADLVKMRWKRDE